MVPVSTFATISWNVAPQRIDALPGLFCYTDNRKCGVRRIQRHRNEGHGGLVQEPASEDAAGEWAGSSLQEKKSESQLPGLIALSILVASVYGARRPV